MYVGVVLVMVKDDKHESSVLDELTSVKITKSTLKWIHRLKTIYERQSGLTFSINDVIYSGISFTDWIYARDKKETYKEYNEYREEIDKKMLEDKDIAVHGLYEEFEAWQQKIKFVDNEKE